MSWKRLSTFFTWPDPSAVPETTVSAIERGLGRNFGDILVKQFWKHEGVPGLPPRDPRGRKKGASANPSLPDPIKQLMEEYGITIERIVQIVQDVLDEADISESGLPPRPARPKLSSKRGGAAGHAGNHAHSDRSR